jgi:aarF domain-containing kinase
VWGFGSLAASMVAGAIGEATSRAMFAPPAGAPLPGVGALSEAQAERLAEGLCRLRGAALKLGQMLSLSDEALLPPVVSKALERVRAQADVMPRRQLEAQMTSELGPDWRARLGGDAFQDAPVAAASIGQVHRSVLPDGRAVAIKVQYPGVAESIDSDLNNLKRLLSVTNFLPKGLYLDPMIEVAREELTAECDYVREAEAQERYRALVADDPDFEVPTVVKELSTRRVLVTTWLPGVPIDAVLENGTPPEERNRIARKLLKLTLKELFEWRFMQVRKEGNIRAKRRALPRPPSAYALPLLSPPPFPSFSPLPPDGPQLGQLFLRRGLPAHRAA